MTTLQEAARKAFEDHWIKTRGAKKAKHELARHPLQPQVYIQDSANRHWVTWQAALAQQGEQQPVAWRHDCNALLTNSLELWIDHCPHCGKPRTTHAEQWPPGLITDIVLTVTALHKEVDIGWSPDARSHLLRLSTSIGMLAAAPAPQQDGTLINVGTKSAPAPQPARGGAELIARATKVASELDDFNASLDRKAAKCIRELLSALQSAQSVVAQPDHIPDAGEMVPLTDDRVIGLLAEHGCIGAQSKNDFVAGLRYGEAAHGIGVGNTIGK